LRDRQVPTTLKLGLCHADDFSHPYWKGYSSGAPGGRPANM
jgi:hypothetical protein